MLEVTGTRKVGRVWVPETRPKLRSWGYPRALLNFYEININYFISISILLNILVLIINIQVSILPTRPPKKNIGLVYPKPARYPPDFCGKNPKPARIWKALLVTALQYVGFLHENNKRAIADNLELRIYVIETSTFYILCKI